MTEETLAHRKEVLREFQYLPLFYLIPKEYATRRKLDKYPRNPMVFATDEHWKAEYHDDYFRVILLDTWALMVWETFGIRGGFTNHTLDYPFVRLATDLPFWVTVAAQLGVNTDALAALPEDYDIPFPELKLAAHNCGMISKYVWDMPQFKLPEMREILNEHKCHEDYVRNKSHIRVDFHRNYYHTRTKWSQMVSLEATIEDERQKKSAYIYNQSEYAELEQRLWLEDFAKRLSERDKQILFMLYQEYTQKEIAEALGYSNHSGVCKRIRHIRKELMQFQKEEKEILNRP